MTQLTDHPGTNPTISLPVARGVTPDCDGIWHHLAEPADFFGVTMPGPDELRTAVLGRVEAAARLAPASLAALTVTLFEVDGAATPVVRVEPVRPVRADPVTIAVLAVGPPVADAGPTAPHWRRMAARTTSHGAADQVRRWLAGHGDADAVPKQAERGAPYLGSLVFDTPSGLRGMEPARPVSILDQLVDCGVAAPVMRVHDRPADATAAWWVSPCFETYPVAGIGARAYAVVTLPPFLELP